MVTELDFTMQNIFQLANLEKQCFGKDAWSIASLRGEFENDFSHFFAKIVDEKIVGYACVRIMYEEAQICNVAVAVDYRRQGIGTQLLQEVAIFAKQQGCERCELEVNTLNTPAVQLYKHAGYVIEGERKNFYRKSRYATRDAYTMILSL